MKYAVQEKKKDDIYIYNRREEKPTYTNNSMTIMHGVILFCFLTFDSMYPS